MAQKATKSSQEKTVDRAAAKVANFKRLATARVNRALKTLDGVGQLSNRNSYTYDEAQVKKIMDALTAKVSEITSRFSKSTVTTADTFTV